MAAIFDYTAETWSTPVAIAGTDSGAGHYETGIQFVLASEKIIGGYALDIAVATTGGLVDASLYTDSSDTMGTIIANTTKTINISSAGIKTFTLDTPKTLAAGKYWLIFHGGDATVNLQYMARGWGQSHIMLTAPASYYPDSAIEAAVFESEAGGGAQNVCDCIM